MVRISFFIKLPAVILLGLFSGAKEKDHRQESRYGWTQLCGETVTCCSEWDWKEPAGW